MREEAISFWCNPVNGQIHLFFLFLSITRWVVFFVVVLFFFSFNIFASFNEDTVLCVLSRGVRLSVSMRMLR